MLKKLKKIELTVESIALIGLIVLSILFYLSETNGKKFKEEQAEINKTSSTTITELSSRLNTLEEALLSTEEKSQTLEEALKEARENTESLKDKFDDVSDVVDELEDISNTDPELLKKYSKVSFLNEHFAPKDLKTISDEYTYDENKKYEIHSEAWPFLRKLMEDAEDDGINLKIISAFRSFGDQSVLKNGYSVTYGAGSANQFSADQGYSEHQLGTTVDFTTEHLGSNFESFGQSEAYNWLKKNAYKHGFVLSYPENNSYYVYEPWHWRFVGEKLARDLDRKDDSLYDWQQRKIDEYIGTLFD